MTALADAEVNYKDNTTKLNYIQFTTEDGEVVMIATTRPELLCTCQAVAVHPKDATKSHLVGKKLITPIYGKKVNVIADEKVDPEYGTGNVMICTIGDKDDLEWVMKYKLPMEKGIDEFGNMTEISGKYQGMNVRDARAAIIEDLKTANVLVKQDDVPQNVSVCWRCSTPIEFLQMPQWFLKTLDFKKEVLKKAEEINWYPEFMKIRLQDWVNSLEWDWVLSRQRIFATPVPVWECEDCDHTVVATEEQCYVDPTEDAPPTHQCPKCNGKLIGSTDVFDTWMDSSGSALYNTFWERDERLFEKLFPMSMRPQSHDIIRTWAFYTILRTNQITHSIPWKDIMIHGFIMAPDGTPMHSSIGNVIDPIPILQEYGADALRYYACTCALGMDHAFREKDVIRGRKLCNKIFNMGKFVGKMLSSRPTMPKNLRLSDRWILSRFSSVVKEVTECYDSYQFDKAMRIVEDFVWHEFADNYIEMVKSRDDDAAKFSLYTVMLGSIKMLAPFLPHVTEEVYQEFFIQHEGIRSIHLTAWPEVVLEDAEAESSGGMLKDVIASVRGWKSDRKMPLNAEIEEIEIIGKTAAALKDGLDDIKDTTKAKKVDILTSADLKEDVVAVKPVHSKLGPTFKGLAKSIVSKLAETDPKDVAGSLKDGFKMTIDGEDVILTSEYVEVENRLLLDGKEVETVQLGDVLIAIRP